MREVKGVRMSIRTSKSVADMLDFSVEELRKRGYEVTRNTVIEALIGCAYDQLWMTKTECGYIEKDI